MKYKTKKTFGAWWGFFLGLIIFTFCIWGVNYSLGPDDKTLKTMIEVLIYLFLGVYLIVLAGAFNTYYILDELGIKIRWGFHSVVIPWENIQGVVDVHGEGNFFSIFGVSWPGHIAGLYLIKGLGTAKIYGTDTTSGFTYIKTSSGYYGLTPEDTNLINLISEKSNNDIEIVDIDKIPKEEKGKNIKKDSFYRLLLTLNIIFIAVFALYLAIFFPGSGAPKFIILLLVLAIGLFFFNITNAARIFQFNEQGGYFLLVLSIAVTGIFLILSLSEVSL
ncbi:MAG TPA: PH domain-containing protein [Syntrophomonadaceae bacterium]|nr:PH domain-containing protein [Syntrophomonadaceae bacterium]